MRHGVSAAWVGSSLKRGKKRILVPRLLREGAAKLSSQTKGCTMIPVYVETRVSDKGLFGGILTGSGQHMSH